MNNCQYFLTSDLVSVQNWRCFLECFFPPSLEQKEYKHSEQKTLEKFEQLKNLKA